MAKGRAGLSTGFRAKGYAGAYQDAGGYQGEGVCRGLSGRRGYQGAIRAKGCRGEGQGANRVRNAKKAGYYARIVDVKKPRDCRALMGYLIASRVIFCTS